MTAIYSVMSCNQYTSIQTKEFYDLDEARSYYDAMVACESKFGGAFVKLQATDEDGIRTISEFDTLEF